MSTASKTQTIKLQTNIPIVGVLKYVDYSKSRVEGWQDQLCLKGTWDGHGEGRVYLPVWLADKMIEQNIVDEDGQDRYENPAYRVTYAGRVQILREEHGTKKVTTILPLGDVGPITAKSAPTAAGAESPPPAASPRRALADGRDRDGRPVAVPASVPPSSDEWAALSRNYHRACDIASRAWSNAEGVVVSADHLVAAAATVFIEANKRGLTVPAPVEKLSPEQKVERIRESFDKFAEKPEALKDEADDDLPF